MRESAAPNGFVAFYSLDGQKYYFSLKKNPSFCLSNQSLEGCFVFSELEVATLRSCSIILPFFFCFCTSQNLFSVVSFPKLKPDQEGAEILGEVGLILVWFIIYIYLLIQMILSGSQMSQSQSQVLLPPQRSFGAFVLFSCRGIF